MKLKILGAIILLNLGFGELTAEVASESSTPALDLLGEYEANGTWRAVRRWALPSIGALGGTAMVIGGFASVEEENESNRDDETLNIGAAYSVIFGLIGGGYIVANTITPLVGWAFSPYSSKKYSLLKNQAEQDPASAERDAAELLKRMADHHRKVRYVSGAIPSAIGSGLLGWGAYEYFKDPTPDSSWITLMAIGGATALFGVSHFIFKSEEENLQDDYSANKKVAMNFAPIVSYNDQSKSMNYGAGLNLTW